MNPCDLYFIFPVQILKMTCMQRL